MQRDLSHQAHLANMNRVVDKVKEVKHNLMTSKHDKGSMRVPSLTKESGGGGQHLQRTSGYWPEASFNALRRPLRPSHRRAASADTSVRAYF